MKQILVYLVYQYKKLLVYNLTRTPNIFITQMSSIFQSFYVKNFCFDKKYYFQKYGIQK